MQPVAYPTRASIRAGRGALVHQQNTVDGDEDKSKDEPKKPEVKTNAQVPTDFPELSLAEYVDLQKEPLNFSRKKQAADRKKDAPHRLKIEELMKSKGAWPFKPGKQYACVPDNGQGADKSKEGGDQPKSNPSNNNQSKDTPGAGSSKKGEAGVVKGYDKVDPLLLKHYKVVHPGIWRVLKAFKDKLADVEKSLVSSQSAKAKADAETERKLYEEKINGLYASHSKSCAWMPEVTQPTNDDPKWVSKEDESKANLAALDQLLDEDTCLYPIFNSWMEVWEAHVAAGGDLSLEVLISVYKRADCCATDEPSGKLEAKLQLLAWMNDWHHDPEHPQFEAWCQGQLKTIHLCGEEIFKLCKGVEDGDAALSVDVKSKIIKWEQDRQSLHNLLRRLRQKSQASLVKLDRCGDGQSRNVVNALVVQLTEDMDTFNGLYEASLTALQKDITTAIDKAVTAVAQAEEVADEVDDEGIKQYGAVLSVWIGASVYREVLLALVDASVFEQLRRIKPHTSRVVSCMPCLEYCDFGSDILTSLDAPEAAMEADVS